MATSLGHNDHHQDTSQNLQKLVHVYSTKSSIYMDFIYTYIKPYPANVENMVSS